MEPIERELLDARRYDPRVGEHRDEDLRIQPLTEFDLKEPRRLVPEAEAHERPERGRRVACQATLLALLGVST